MAYQPKSYRKFLATTVTASLVATAVAPVAGLAASNFTDVNSNYEAAVNFLVENEITSGLTETTFGTSAQITRGDAAVLVAKALELDTDLFEAAPFTDVNARQAGAVSALYALNVINGKTDTTFAPNAPITRQEMAKVIANAFELVGAGEALPFTDVNSTFSAYVDALYTNGITSGKTETSFGSTQEITRGEFAIFLFRALTEEVVEATEVEEVKAVGVKKLEVVFNGEVDADAAVFTVKKGTSNQGIAKVVFAEDNKSATIELNNKLTAGDYTVSVSGLTEEALTSEVTVENEAVAAVKLLSDKAIMKDDDTVEVGYQIENQYGEAMTVASNPIATSTRGTATATSGKVTIDLATGSTFKSGETLVLTLIDSASAKSVSASLTVSSVATTNNVAFNGIVDSTNKIVETVKQEDNAKDFFLSVAAKDQYDRAVTDVAKLNNDLLVTVSNPTLVDLVDTNAGTAGVQPFAEVTDAAGKKHTTIKLDVKDAYGEAIVTVVSKSTGVAVTYKVTVNEKVKVDTIVVNAPEVSLVAGGDTVLLPVTATDNKGQSVTTVEALGGLTPSVTGVNGSTASYVAKDGKLFVEVKVGDVASTGTIIVSTTSGTGKVDTEIVAVKATAVPNAIVGLKSDVQTAIYAGESVSVDWKDFVIQDQYSREMKYTEEAAKYAVKAVASSDKVEVTTDSTATTAIALKGAKKGTESITFTLVDVVNTKDVAATDMSFRTVEFSEFTSFGADDIATVYANDTTADYTDVYAKTVKVYGVTADGKKVYLPASEYTVFSNSDNLAVNPLNSSEVDAVGDADPKTTFEKSAKLTITLIKNGVEVSKDVAISEVSPSVAKVEYLVDTKAVTAIEFDDADLTTVNLGVLQPSVKVTDSYGIATGKTDVDNTITRITFSNIVEKSGSDIVVTANGLSTAAIAGLAEGDTFDATIVVGGQTLTLDVTVK
ncbi:S-layer homology domain-containing protein [Cytobacillus sp. S13-E01]|uniref:S-layer homology domain-containing protein n=1 Tax=Cytobacillus sp. S13-E01 TaxID=3031326 RepID=UPI0023D88E64|nr:S-layer homology domain-containing protein [Cytobacillus sp. S13-E01]MDF0726050.1 S-layer homology domain-containing protein [Cytobacillus sp. S13-E01]